MKYFLENLCSKLAPHFLLVLLVNLTCSSIGFSQTAPPNDNLTNATVLTGTDVAFSGSLNGATFEDSADAAPGNAYSTAKGSIWWSWTSPTSTVLNLEVQQFQSDGENALDILTVYAATNGTTSPAGLLQPPLANLALWAGPAFQSLSIPVSAGSNYFIQLSGNSSNYVYHFRLLAQNAPLIFKQPLSQTVDSNASTIFYVLPGGLQPRSFQWYFNGAILPGETAPILALTNIDGIIAGSYSVLVSNAAGSVMSSPATLAVSQSNVPPVLTAIEQGSNFIFNLAGEMGRAYGIQSSTNLIDWVPEKGFAVLPQGSSSQYYDQFVYSTNSPLVLNVANNSPSKYYRAFIYRMTDPIAAICINNLRQIAIAKLLAQLDLNINPMGEPPTTQLTPYLPHPESMYCPLDEYQMFMTSYNIETLGHFPICNFNPAHLLKGVP